MRTRFSILIVSIAVCIFCLVGCSGNTAHHTGSVSRDQAIAIAQEEMGDVFRWYKYSVTKEDDSWEVDVDLKTNTPGDHCTIIIDNEGKVLRVVGGL